MNRISIQGYRGSFHDIVTREKFTGDSEVIERGAFYEVYEDVKSGRADLALLL